MIALLNPRDHLHEKALTVSERFSAAILVTSEMVRVEFLNGFSDRGPRLRKAVAHAVEALRSDRNVIVMPQNIGAVSKRTAAIPASDRQELESDGLRKFSNHAN